MASKRWDYYKQRDLQAKIIERMRADLVIGENGRPYLPDPEYPHGSAQTYNFGNCRCDECTEAQRERHIKRVSRKVKMQDAPPDLALDPTSVFRVGQATRKG